MPPRSCFRSGCLLAALLAAAVLTVWVSGMAATALVQGVAMLASSAVLVADLIRRRVSAPGLAPAVFCAAAAWGALQQFSGWAAVHSAVREAALYWLAAACIAFLARRASVSAHQRDTLLTALLSTGVWICIVGILQLFTSGARIFWYFPSGYTTRVIGPFVSPNNFAAFVELLLPIALYFALERRAGIFLAASAVLLACACASASRAGIVLALGEVAVVFLLRWRQPHEQRRTATALLIFAAASAAFMLVLGWRQTWQRLHESNLLGLRRDLLESSLAMFRARPVYGFGLGTWSFVYPQFATVDPGAAVNHSHNEWIQWAAEGGLPLLLLMLALLACTLRPAVRSLWGIGTIAVFLHAIVDYPFLRFGLAAWVFALLGMLGASRSGSPPAEGAPRRDAPWRQLSVAAMALVLAAGAIETGRLGWADALSRMSAESLCRAARLNPEEAEFSFALAGLDPEHAAGWLKCALAANPYHTKARLALAGELETGGDAASAEAQLLEAADRDRRYAPAWALANFYFRQQRPQSFWPWARRSAEMAYGDRGPLFQLCFLEEGSVPEVCRRLGGSRAVARSMLAWLTAADRLDEALPLAREISAGPVPPDLPVLLDYVDLALQDGDSPAAASIWDALDRQDQLHAANAAGRGFDWRAGAAGFSLERRGQELAVSVSGRQPEQAGVVGRYVSVRPGEKYCLQFDYLTDRLPEPTGLSWSIEGIGPLPLSAAETWTHIAREFRAPPQARVLALAYRRAAGTTRCQGSVRFRNLLLAPANSDIRAKVSGDFVR